MYFKVFILVSLVADIYSANINVLTRLNLYRAARIIGGKDAVPGQFPYIISIQALPDPGSEYSHTHSCGGAILNEQWILTAAHCLHDDGGPLVVRAGKYDLNKNETNEQIATVEKFFRHNLFTGNGLSHDIALMKLQTPLKLNQHVAKIALPEKDSEPAGQLGTFAGWGYWTMEPGHGVSSILQSITLPIIDNKTCNEAVKKVNPEYSLFETNICTAASPIGVCGGDSGGPLTVTNDRGITEIVGILSWSFNPCAGEESPDGYIRVSLFIDWIEDTINANK